MTWRDINIIIYTFYNFCSHFVGVKIDQYIYYGRQMLPSFMKVIDVFIINTYFVPDFTCAVVSKRREKGCTVERQLLIIHSKISL